MVKPSERLERSLKVDNLWQYIISALKTPKYAYDLSRELKKLNVSMITVYTVLYKLELGGYVKRTFSKKKGGPPRKYYITTEKGNRELTRGKNIIKNHLKGL